MVARRQPPLPQDHGRHLSRGAEKPRGVLRHLQRRSRARFADARRRGRSRRARGQAHDRARVSLYRLRAAGPADHRDARRRQILSVAAAGRVRHRGAREEHARPALGLRQDPHPPLDRISGDGGGGGAAARARFARRSARGVHRHQSAAGAAQGHGGAVRRRARRARVQGARRAGARPDHVDEDDVHSRPLSPPRRRRAGAAAAGKAIRGVTRRGRRTGRPQGSQRLYRVPEILTLGRFPDARESDSTWRTQEVRHVGSDTIAPRLWCVPAAWLAKKTKDGPQARRLLALAAIYDGATRTEAAMIGGVGLQIIRDWVLHFNERGPDGLLNGKSPGQPSKLNDVQRQAIARMIESGPIPAVHGVVRWRLIDLAQWIFEEFRIAIAKQTLSRELRAMGYRKLSARPRHHAQAEGAIEDFKKTSPRAWRQLRARRRLTATR